MSTLPILLLWVAFTTQSAHAFKGLGTQAIPTGPTAQLSVVHNINNRRAPEYLKDELWIGGTHAHHPTASVAPLGSTPTWLPVHLGSNFQKKQHHTLTHTYGDKHKFTWSHTNTFCSCTHPLTCTHTRTSRCIWLISLYPTRINGALCMHPLNPTEPQSSVDPTPSHATTQTHTHAYTHSSHPPAPQHLNGSRNPEASQWPSPSLS